MDNEKAATRNEVDMIGKFLWDKNPRVRLHAVRAISRCAQHPNSQRYLALGALDKDKQVSSVALTGLSALSLEGSTVDTLLACVIGRCNVNGPAILRFLGEAAGVHSERVTRVCRSLLQSKDKSVALAAIKALCGLGDVSGKRRLIELSRDPFHLFRRRAFELFKCFPNDLDFVELAYAERNSKDHLIRKHSEDYLSISDAIFSPIARKSTTQVAESQSIASELATLVTESQRGALSFSTYPQGCPIAVFDMRSDGVERIQANILTDRITQHFIALGHFRVIERKDMQRVLTEQGFQQTDCTDDACVVRAGKVLGAHKMVGGSFGKIGDLYTISLKVIDVQSGQIERMASLDARCDLAHVFTIMSKTLVLRLFESR